MYELKDALIRLIDVGITYGDKPILAGVNAEIRDIVRPNCIQGQVIGILGPSGIGKTQLARIMTGLQQPTSGSVVVGPKQEKVAAGLVGYVPQNYPLLRHRTVLGNLTKAAQRVGLGTKQAEEKAMDYLKRFALEDKWDVYPVQLSGGQRQRVAIAQQLLCSEHYLILDEPTTGLDPIMRDRVCDLIKQVAGMAEENTILLVSHDIQALLTVCDRLWLLGRNWDDKGTALGASIKFQYDLIEREIAWEQNAQQLPQFAELLREIRSKFEEL